MHKNLDHLSPFGPECEVGKRLPRNWSGCSWGARLCMCAAGVENLPVLEAGKACSSYVRTRRRAVVCSTSSADCVVGGTRRGHDSRNGPARGRWRCLSCGRALLPRNQASPSLHSPTRTRPGVHHDRGGVFVSLVAFSDCQCTSCRWSWGSAVVAPCGEVSVHRALRRQVMGTVEPRAVSAGLVAGRVHKLPRCVLASRARLTEGCRAFQAVMTGRFGSQASSNRSLGPAGCSPTSTKTPQR